MYLLIFITSSICIWIYIDRRIVVYRELKRFHSDTQDLRSIIEGVLERIYTSIGIKVQRNQPKASVIEKEMGRRLKAAGLESAAEIGQFYLIRYASTIGIPLLASITYLYFSTYYATVTLIFSTLLAIFIPQLWLKARISKRTEDIQRELPLLIDLTNLGTSAGWDVTTALEKVIDALVVEFPTHPLFREYRKARWLASTGYTWGETLERLNQRTGNDGVRRCNLALVQAMKQGGNRTAQLEGIAADAERVYYSELDKRLATLPVKVILITMLLLIAYFMVVLAPAAVNIKQVVSGKNQTERVNKQI